MRLTVSAGFPIMHPVQSSWIRYLPAALAKRLEGRTSLQQAIHNTGWLFADNILRMAVGFLVSIWITRYLGPEKFGQLNYAISFVLLFSSLAQLGLDGIVVRDLVHDPSRKDEILGSATTLKGIGGIASAVLAIAAIFVMRPHDLETVLLVGVTALGLVFQTFGTIDYWFQSQLQAKHSAKARMVAYLVSSAAKIALILLHAPLITFAWAGVAEILIGSVGFIVAYRHCGHAPGSWKVRTAVMRRLLHDSWPLILAELVMVIYTRIDKVMIGEIAGNAELGVYAVAALLAESLCLIPRSLACSVNPFLLEAQQDNRLFQQRLQHFYNLMAFCAYAIAVPVTLAATWVVPLLFGAAYAKATTMLIGLVWSGVFINLGLARSYYLTAMNWTRLHFAVDLIGCGANLALNLILIPRYGALGAVMAAFAGYLITAYGTCFIFKPLRDTGMMMTRALLYPKVW